MVGSVSHYDRIDMIIRESTKMSRKQQLKVEIKDGVLSISIGVATLAHAVTVGNNIRQDIKITDVDEAAKSIVDALTTEQEDGSTPVHMMLDRAVEHALDQGLEGFDIEEDA